jgi:hypothetical protein
LPGCGVVELPIIFSLIVDCGLRAEAVRTS